jgi:small-conductance mechanosensitive channel
VIVVPPAAVFGLPEWAGRLVLVGVILVAAALILAGVGWLMARVAARTHAAGGTRIRQRQTAITALATGIRYAVLVAALIAIAFVLAGGGGIGAIGGASLVVIIIGFASQRLLVDVIAGFFILFEDQYGVGDVIRVEPFGYAGRVHSLGLRTTVLDGPAGERLIVPNGNITAVRVIPSGRRPHRIEFLTRDPERLEATVRELAGAVTGGGGPWRAMPRLTRRAGDDGLTRVVAVVDVDAAREEATQWLTDAVAERAADVLAAPPLRSVNPGATDR